MTGRSLVYVDIGVPDAKSFWQLVVVTRMAEFKLQPSPGSAMVLAWSLWHIHEWIWYDRHPQEDTWKSKAYDEFCDNLTADGACPELRWLQDLANISKHRALGRKRPEDISIVQQKVTSGKGGGGGYGVNALAAYGSGHLQVRLIIQDGSVHWLDDVAEKVFAYWQRNFFSEA